MNEQRDPVILNIGISSYERTVGSGVPECKYVKHMNRERCQVFWKCKYILHMNGQRDPVYWSVGISSYE